MSEPLLVEREGGIAWLRFNRPERLNAIDAAMAVAFRDAVRTLPGDATLRCVVLAGEGRAFMAGGDITAFGNPDAIASIMDPMHEALALLADLPVPVLASVQGAAAGGGMSIALAADLCIAADNAKFNLAYLRLGTSPDCGGSWNLARLVGLRRALGIALLEEVLDAPAALALGLVNKVVPAAELAEATAAMARKLAAGPREATSGAIDFAPYRRHCIDQQQAMEAAIGALRQRLRDALSRRSLALARLAAIDAVMDQTLAARERGLLGLVPLRLQSHFEQLQRAAPGDTAWAGTLRDDMDRVLRAELAHRLLPAQGLLDALNTHPTT